MKSTGISLILLCLISLTWSSVGGITFWLWDLIQKTKGELQGNENVKVYTECDYGGEELELTKTGITAADLTDTHNNKIRSFTIPYGKTMTVYTDDNFTGDNNKTYTSSVACLTDENPATFDQSISSAIII
jgi:hypothetical protein